MQSKIQEQLSHTLRDTQLNGLGEKYGGKVRDVYRKGDKLFLIASDRLSAFDRILTTIPYKGEVLNRLAGFWFGKTSHVVKNHVLDMPDPNVTVARRCEPFKVEVIVRGYITGSLWRDYEGGNREVYGLRFDAGMKKDQRFDRPIITPSTKAPQGEHDEPISSAEVVSRGLANERDWARICEAALGLFSEGQAWAKTRGLILVDTKYEFGKVGDELYVIDEIHTPDSSRFWMANEYDTRFRAGQEQKMLDKENVRQWLIKERNFKGDGEPPTIPDPFRVETAEKYLSAYEQITGAPLVLNPGDVLSRMEKNLRAKSYL